MLIGKVGHLIGTDYDLVRQVTLPGDEPWPASVLFDGRVFVLYPVTRPTGVEPNAETYREVTCFKVPSV